MEWSLFFVFNSILLGVGLILLLFIGGKMVKEGIQDGAEEAEKAKVGALALLVQGIATSIDALSVGFTIAEYDFIMALACSLIIAVVTFVISFAGLILGKKFGTKFSNKATILGGAILIAIGIEIFVSGVF